MKINSTTLLFEELTEAQADELVALARTISRDGKIDWNAPLLLEWMGGCGFKAHAQELLVASTVFPAKAFDSVLAFMGK